MEIQIQVVYVRSSNYAFNPYVIDRTQDYLPHISREPKA